MRGFNLNQKKMKSFQNVRVQFHHQYLHQQLKSNPRKESKMTNFELARSIGIIFDATDPSRRDRVLKYIEKIKKDNKSVKALGFFNNKIENPNFVFKYYNVKNLDWAYRPTGDEVEFFMDQNFDLLINVDPETKIHTEFIAALSKANLRVGPYTENTYCYDLMIDTSGSKDLNHFIQEIERLLLKTNTRYEAA